MKKTKYVVLFAMLAVSACVSRAQRSEEITLVMVPREAGAMRVGMDIANRFPTLLISYKLGMNGAVSLHGWNGSDWVNIAREAFAGGGFFRTGPTSALLVEKEGNPLPGSLVPAEEWCPSVYKISTTETRPLLHLVGQFYNFKYKTWDWFATNYKLSLESINPEGLNVAWYHRRFSDHLKDRKTVGVDDLQYWRVVRLPEEPAEPVSSVAEEPATPVEEDSAAAEPDASLEAVPEEAMDQNPLTNAVPEAVVLGAGDAEESFEGVPVEGRGKTVEE